jgi:two-component system sensor histidine kinase RegB
MRVDVSLRGGHIARSMAAPATTYAPAVTLAWLVRLRWGSVVAQAVTVLVGVFALGAPTSLLADVVIAVTAGSNIALFAAARKRRAVGAGVLGAVLVFDTVALTALLFLCGGPSNPFSTLYLVYVTLAALALGIRWASVAIAVSAAGYALLFLAGDQAAAMAHMHHDGSAFSAHLQAMWVAFTVTAALIAYFVARVARALREREDELAEARNVAGRAEKLASLSTLAAGAAHELGTPLGTIAVVSKELELVLKRTPGLSTLSEDARLIRDEVERCRRIVQQMSGRSGEAMGEVPEPVVLADLLKEARRQSLSSSSPILASELLVDVDAAVPARLVLPVRGLVQSLRNLLHNAWDAGGPASDVRLRVRRANDRVTFEVEDRGMGMTSEVLERVGEPFFTTKLPGEGTGLGLFLARTFAERWQGRLTLESEAGRGTRAVLELPLTPEEPTDVA